MGKAAKYLFKFNILGFVVYNQHFYMLKLFAIQRIVSEDLGLICQEGGTLDFEEVGEAEIDME